MAWSLINSSDWQLEKETIEGDTVHSKLTKGGSKVFRLTAKVHIPAQDLLNQLFDLIEEMPSWNPTVIESQRLQVFVSANWFQCFVSIVKSVPIIYTSSHKISQVIDKQTDITYQVSAAGGGGVVACRDFVVLRHWNLRDGAYVSAGASIPHPMKPPNKQYIRYYI